MNIRPPLPRPSSLCAFQGGPMRVNRPLQAVLRVRPAWAGLWFAVVMVSPAACASAHRPAETDRSVISLEQIRSANVETAYELVSKFRPDFLRSRGPNTILLKQTKEPRVYLDDVDFGTITSLRSIQASNIAGMRFIEGRDAMTKYGSDHVGGVIEIYTRY